MGRIDNCITLRETQTPVLAQWLAGDWGPRTPASLRARVSGRFVTATASSAVDFCGHRWMPGHADAPRPIYAHPDANPRTPGDRPRLHAAILDVEPVAQQIE